MHSLLVEDERDLAGPLTQLLHRERYDVVWADALAAAYDALAEGPFDLAVLDVMLPEGEDAGFRLAETLRAGDFAGHILFLTARDSVEDRIRGLDLGGAAGITKVWGLGSCSSRASAAPCPARSS